MGHNLYCLRTSDQYEIDLVIDFSGMIWSIEIKLTTNPTPADYQRLRKTSELIGSNRRFLISRIAKPSLSKDGGVCSLEDFLKEF